MIDPVHEALSPAWETKMKFQALVIYLTHPWPLWPSGVKQQMGGRGGGSGISLSVYPFLCVFHFSIQISKSLITKRNFKNYLFSSILEIMNIDG